MPTSLHVRDARSGSATANPYELLPAAEAHRLCKGPPGPLPYAWSLPAIRAASTVYFIRRHCGNAARQESFTVWIMDGCTQHRCQIGQTSYATCAAAGAMQLRAATFLWTQALAVRIAKLSQAIQSFHQGLCNTTEHAAHAELFQHHRNAMRLAKAASATIQWDGDNTLITWTDAIGQETTEKPAGIAKHISDAPDREKGSAMTFWPCAPPE